MARRDGEMRRHYQTVIAKSGTNEKNSPIDFYSAPCGGTAPGDFVRFNVGHCSFTGEFFSFVPPLAIII